MNHVSAVEPEATLRHRNRLPETKGPQRICPGFQVRRALEEETPGSLFFLFFLLFFPGWEGGAAQTSSSASATVWSLFTCASERRPNGTACNVKNSTRNSSRLSKPSPLLLLQLQVDQEERGQWCRQRRRRRAASAPPREVPPAAT